jgi:hypothetical protein
MAIQKMPQNVGSMEIGGYGSVKVEDQNGITTLTLVDENHTQINEWLLDIEERLGLIALLQKGWEE